MRHMDRFRQPREGAHLLRIEYLLETGPFAPVSILESWAVSSWTGGDRG